MQSTEAEGREVLNAIRRIVRVLRESSVRAERRVGISGAQLFVLQNLADARTMSVNELAARSLTHQSTVSVVVRKLAARGLVAKARAAEDGRRVELTVTAKGRALLARAPDAAQGRLIDGVRRLAAADRRTAARILRRLAASVEATPQETVMFFEDEVPAGARGARPKAAARRRA